MKDNTPLPLAPKITARDERLRVERCNEWRAKAGRINAGLVRHIVQQIVTELADQHPASSAVAVAFNGELFAYSKGVERETIGQTVRVHVERITGISATEVALRSVEGSHNDAELTFTPLS